MRRKLLLIVLLLAVIVAIFMLRGKKQKQIAETNSRPTDNAVQTVAIQKGDGEAILGTVTTLPDNAGVTITVEKDGETKEYTFTDISIEDWHVEAVNYAVANGLMSGVSKGETSLFHPDYGMTHAEFAMILYRFLGGEPVQPKQEYTDVSKDDWYYDCINWVDSKRLMSSISAEEFGVNEFFSCEEVLTILYRAAGKPKTEASLEDYPYAAKVSENSMDAVRWAWGNDLIKEDECVWYPTQAISRAQIAMLLMRYDLLIDAESAK